ncbi:MAG: hypothetical protein ACKVKH_18740, partial [Verrucomicrobiales bacterium]
EFTHAAFIRFRLRRPAARMNSQLGGWPGFYGDDGLSQQVIVHAKVAQWLFTVVLLAALAMPLLIGLFALVPQAACQARLPRLLRLYLLAVPVPHSPRAQRLSELVVGLIPRPILRRAVSESGSFHRIKRSARVSAQRGL